MSAEPLEEPPDWLPDGWIMEVRTTRRGTKHASYISPVSRRTFHSRLEVMRYLNFEQFGEEPEESSEVGDSEQRSCFPSSGSRFYSKEEVVQYLKNGKGRAPSSNHQKSFRTRSSNNVHSEFYYSPAGLPKGWIKEVKFRKTTLNKSGIRKDLYYIEPIDGYVFRSLRDASRYISNGELAKYCAKRGKKRRTSDMYILESESSPPISAKRLKLKEGTPSCCLFSEQMSDSDGETTTERDHFPEEPQCVEVVDLICSTPTRSKQSNEEVENGGTNKMLPESANSSKVETWKTKGKILEPEPSDPLENKELETMNQIPLDLSERQQQDLENPKLSDMVEKFFKLSEKKRQKPTQKRPSELESGNTPQMENGKHLYLENESLPILEVNPLDQQNEKLFLTEENLLKPENILLLPEA